MLALCGVFTVAFALATDLVLAHQSGYPVLATIDTFASQNSMNPWTAIGLAAILRWISLIFTNSTWFVCARALGERFRQA